MKHALKGIACLVAAFVLFDYAADELARLLGELFADAVISTDNAKEGIEDDAA